MDTNFGIYLNERKISNGKLDSREKILVLSIS